MLARQHRDKMLTKVQCPAPHEQNAARAQVSWAQDCALIFGLNALAWGIASRTAAFLSACPFNRAQTLEPALQAVEQLLLCCVAAVR